MDNENGNDTFRIAYASGMQHGRSMKQAMELAKKITELMPKKVEIEVLSEETFRLRKENAKLRARLGMAVL